MSNKFMEARVTKHYIWIFACLCAMCYISKNVATAVIESDSPIERIESIVTKIKGK
jgi:hypothetical protein